MAHIIVTRISSAKINLMANLAMGSPPSVGWECIFLSREEGREEEEDQMVAQWHKLPQREWKMTGTQLLSLLSCWRCPVLKSSRSISRGLYAVLLIFQIIMLLYPHSHLSEVPGLAWGPSRVWRRTPKLPLSPAFASQALRLPCHLQNGHDSRLRRVVETLYKEALWLNYNTSPNPYLSQSSF